MEAEVLTTLISSVGFPIAAFVMMYSMMNTTLKANTDATNDLRIVVENISERLK